MNGPAVGDTASNTEADKINDTDSDTDNDRDGDTIEDTDGDTDDDRDDTDAILTGVEMAEVAFFKHFLASP